MTFYKAIQTYDVTQTLCAFSAYAKICLHHRVCNMIRYHSSKKEYTKYMQALDDMTVQVADSYADFMIDKIDKLSLIKQYCLPQEQQLIHYLLQGYNYQQIANYFGWDYKKVTNKVYKIRKKLAMFATKFN